MSSGAPEIHELETVAITVQPWSWPFAAARRQEIDRHFACRRRRQPALWNGRVLLLNRYAIDGGMLRGTAFETDYASFLAWRDWDFPDAEVFNVFGAAALQAADDAFLVGEMAPSTAGAGKILFPCGTPDPEDVRDGVLDLAGSVGRELLEETGIDLGTLEAKPGWRLIRDGNLVAVLRQLVAREDAQELQSRILRYLANTKEPEFSGIRIVRGPADLEARMPRFLRAFFEQIWR